MPVKFPQYIGYCCLEGICGRLSWQKSSVVLLTDWQSGYLVSWIWGTTMVHQQNFYYLAIILAFSRTCPVETPWLSTLGVLPPSSRTFSNSDQRLYLPQKATVVFLHGDGSWCSISNVSPWSCDAKLMCSGSFSISSFVFHDEGVCCTYEVLDQGSK